MRSVMNIAIFASGSGSNLQALIDATLSGQIKGRIACCVVDNPNAYAIKRAQMAGIDTLVLSPKMCTSRDEWEQCIVEYLQQHQVQLVVLAGFMRIIGERLLSHFAQRMINIHPSLLPNFPGRTGIQDAYESGVTITGVTVHYVDSGIDTGPIIAQQSLEIDPSWTLDTLETHIHEIEHRLYPQVIATLVNHGESIVNTAR